jgi:acyl-CoA synthetase (AMP-forming)/AMP-acid ligase II
MKWLFERIEGAGSSPSLATESGVSSYTQLSVAVSDACNKISDANIPNGAVVSLLSDYSIESIAWFLALAKHGCIVVPIATQNKEEINIRLKEGNIEWNVAFDNGKAQTPRYLAEAPQCHEIITRLRTIQHPGLVLFSSGSTGKPKAMVHDLANLIETYTTRKPRHMAMMVFLMFDHIGGINTLFHSLASGSCMVIPPNRSPDTVCRLIEQHKVSVLPASPTFLNLLLISGAHERFDMSSVKVITYGTEPMPESLLLKVKNTFPKARFIQTFGTSETGILQTTSESSSSINLRLDDPNIETKIVAGELWLRSKTQILGYLNHDMASFTSDGWFQTGDLVEEHDNGFIRIIGRLKEMINVGGQKVVPGEVESVLLCMEDVQDCMVFAEPNPIMGQVVASQIVLKQGASKDGFKSRMRRFCSEHLEAYKIPVRICFVENTSFGERFKKLRILGTQTK